MQPRILARATFNVTAPASGEASMPLNGHGAAAKQGVFDDFPATRSIALESQSASRPSSNQIWAEGRGCAVELPGKSRTEGNGATDSGCGGQSVTGAQI